MKSIADIKRAMRPGVTVHVINHVYPILSGDRVVLRAQTNQWMLSFPEGHPKHAGGDHAGSWLDIPKKGQVTFEGENSFTIARSPEWNDPGPFCTITILP